MYSSFMFVRVNFFRLKAIYSPFGLDNFLNTRVQNSGPKYLEQDVCVCGLSWVGLAPWLSPGSLEPECSQPDLIGWFARGQNMLVQLAP